MDWAHHQSQVRFDIRVEREEYARLFQHQARVLQDRMARRGRTDRTRQPAISEWERVYQTEAEERRLLHQACRCSKIMSPHNCNETLSPFQDGDDESERVPTGESD